MNVVSLIAQAGIVGKGVLLILLYFSVMSWALIFLKLRMLRTGQRESQRFLHLFRSSKNLYATFEESKRFTRSPLAAVFQEGYRELSQLVKGNPGHGNPGPGTHDAPAKADLVAHREPLELISRGLRHASMKEIAHYERNLIFLATTGSVTPFIGLFGTVWGIMDAFASIGHAGSANLGAVAPGISEALIATAAGLAAAIPAVIAYNYFVNRIRRLGTELEIFGMEFLNLAERILVRSR
jgi:biopolymer transport protein TolQ